MYNVDDIFYYDDNYSFIAEFCNKSNLKIVEIESDEKGRRFQIKNVEFEINYVEEEINNIKKWFNNYYSQHEEKYRRLHTLNQLCDDGKNPYDKLIELYNEAEVRRKRIQELEQQRA